MRFLRFRSLVAWTALAALATPAAAQINLPPIQRVNEKNNRIYWWDQAYLGFGSAAPFELRRAPIPTTTPCDLSTAGYTVFATETSGARSFYTDLLCASAEVGVVAWVSFNGELSWKPINATLADPNRRSASFPYLPTGGLELVPGPTVCITLP